MYFLVAEIVSKAEDTAFRNYKISHNFYCSGFAQACGEVLDTITGKGCESGVRLLPLILLDGVSTHM
jgi:hypothetical protein